MKELIKVLEKASVELGHLTEPPWCAYTQVVAEVRDHVRKALAREKSDTERLNWLEDNFYSNSLRFIPGSPTMDGSHPPRWSLWTYKEGTTTRPTLREAVDAAIEQEPEKLCQLP